MKALLWMALIAMGIVNISLAIYFITIIPLKVVEIAVMIYLLNRLVKATGEKLKGLYMHRPNG